MGTKNILHQLNHAVTEDESDAIVTDISLSPQGIATTGTRATAENSVPADVIVIDADGEDVIVGFTVPRDYAEARDKLRVQLLVSHVSGTSIALQADSVSRARSGTATADESDFTAVTADTINAAFDTGYVTATLDDLTWLGGDMVAVNFIASARTSTGIAHVIGARIVYESLIVPSNTSDRAPLS